MSDVEERRWVDFLEEEDLVFVKRFILVSGSLKELAGAYDVSYPTLRLRLDRLIEKIKILDTKESRTVTSGFLRAQFADAKIEPSTFKALLNATTTKERFQMKTRVFSRAGIGDVDVGPGPEKLAEYDWSSLSKAGRLLGGEPVTVDSRPALRISNTNDVPMQLRVLVIDSPAVSKRVHALQGEIRYEQVRGEGYLEMWSVFPPLKPGMQEDDFSAGPWRYLARWAGSRGRQTGEPSRCLSIGPAPLGPRSGLNSICSCPGMEQCILAPSSSPNSTPSER